MAKLGQNIAGLRSAAFFDGATGALQSQMANRSLLTILPAVLELVLAVALGVLTVMTMYALFAPLPVSEPLKVAAASSPTTSRELLTGANPFATSAVQVNPANNPPVLNLTETTLDLALHGTWVDADGGAAIIQTPDGEQKRFVAGDAIWNGVVLDQVFREQVVLLSGGVRESLSLVNRDVVSSPAAAPPLTVSAPQNSNASLGEVVQISPMSTSDGMKLVLSPGVDRQAFDRIGLMDGDILVSVNGGRVGDNVIADMSRISDLAGQPNISIVVERNGVSVPIGIELNLESAADEN